MRLRTATSGRLASLRESDPRYRALAEGRPIPPAPPLPCVHRGDVTGERECASCGGNVRLKVHACAVHGGCTIGKRLDGLASCRECPDREPPALVQASAPLPEPVFVPLPGDLSCGVVVGTYGPWAAALAELQVRLIRHTAGDVPILIADDASPDPAALFAVGERHAGVTVWANGERIGHCGGDLSALWKGLQWAKSLRLAQVCKLSQRFIWTRPRWLQDQAGALDASGLPLSTCESAGREPFPHRTECLLLDVASWHTPRLLAALTPRRWPEASSVAEFVFDGLFREHTAGVYLPWLELGEDRYRPRDGYLWHCGNAPADYHALARRFGVRLPADYHCDGWQRDAAEGRYRAG